jgi:hypothetical protein
LGRRTRTLYGGELPRLLGNTVGQVRALCGLDPRPSVAPQLDDRIRFFLLGALGAATGVLMFLAGLAAAPFVLVLASKRDPRSASSAAQP